MSKTENREERLINFRCNVDLLEMFSALCHSKNSNISKELRYFMNECVSAGVILKKNKGDVNTGSGDFRDSLNIGSIHNIPKQW